MLGGLKHARFELSNIRQPQLKPKHAQVQQNNSLKTVVDKEQQVEDDDDLLPELPRESAPHKSSSAVVIDDAITDKDLVGASKAAGPPKGHEPTAASDAGSAKAGQGERGRPRTRPSSEHAPAPKKQLEQQTQAEGSGVSQSGSQLTSTDAPQLRTGDDIWQLNLQLGKMVEQLAEPEDSKAGRRKQNGPTLTENLTKRWGGNYSQLLDKSFATEDVEEPPPPKYEPPRFLDDATAEDAEGDDSLQPGPSANAGMNAALEAGSKGLKGTFGGTAPAAPNQKGATGAAATKSGHGRRAAAIGGRKAAAGKGDVAAGAVVIKAKLVATADAAGDPDQSREDVNGCQDTATDMETGYEVGEVQTSGRERQTEELPLAPRRGGRKAKASAKEPAVKTSKMRIDASARRNARAVATTAKVAAAADQDPGDPMDIAPTSITAPPPLSGSSNPTRPRKSVVSVTAFGSTISKPPLPPPQADFMDDVAANGSDLGVVAAKRARDVLTTLDEKQRLSKACRTEQQQMKDNEALRSKNAELEVRCRQQSDQLRELKEERTAAEKWITGLEMERKRDASDLAAAQREIEKLKAELKDRDDKIKARDTEISKLRQSMLEVKQLKDQMDAVMKSWLK